MTCQMFKLFTQVSECLTNEFTGSSNAKMQSLYTLPPSQFINLNDLAFWVNE